MIPEDKQDNKLLRDGIAIRCYTVSQLERVLSIAGRLGCRWASGDLFSDFRPDFTLFGYKTCINLHDGCYGSEPVYEAKGFAIVRARAFIAMYEPELVQLKIPFKFE